MCQANSSAARLPGLLVDPAWLFANLNQPNLRILDVRLIDSYEEEHLPGAAWIDLASLTCTVDDVAGMLLTPAEFAEIMGKLGVDRNTAVVLLDDNWGMPAARVVWSLMRYGHKQVSILNGGWDAWKNEGYPTSTERPTIIQTTFIPETIDEHIADRQWILDHIDDPNLVLIDTRTRSEFEQGHLPHALSWDWMNGVPLAGPAAMRPAQELRAELAKLGVTPDKDIVTYCRSGARAAHTFLLLRHLGFPCVRNYDGSWLEWTKYQ